MAPTRKRLTREQSKALTREKIFEAAAKAFARRGYAGAAVDEIAEEAGFSRGAFYFNFTSKDDLFLQLIERQLRYLTEDAHSIISGSSSAEETLRRLREFYILIRSQDKTAYLLITEAQLYAIRNTRFRSKLTNLFRGVHQKLVLSLQQLNGQTGLHEPVPPPVLALTALALSQGLMLYSMMDSKAYSSDMVSLASELVFDRLLHLE